MSLGSAMNALTETTKLVLSGAIMSRETFYGIISFLGALLTLVFSIESRRLQNTESQLVDHLGNGFSSTTYSLLMAMRLGMASPIITKFIIKFVWEMKSHGTPNFNKTSILMILLQLVYTIVLWLPCIFYLQYETLLEQFKFQAAFFNVARYLFICITLLSCESLSIKVYDTKYFHILLYVSAFLVQIYICVCFFVRERYEDDDQYNYSIASVVLSSIVNFGILAYALAVLRGFVVHLSETNYSWSKCTSIQVISVGYIFLYITYTIFNSFNYVVSKSVFDEYVGIHHSWILNGIFTLCILFAIALLDFIVDRYEEYRKKVLLAKDTEGNIIDMHQVLQKFNEFINHHMAISNVIPSAPTPYRLFQDDKNTPGNTGNTLRNSRELYVNNTTNNGGGGGVVIGGNNSNNHPNNNNNSITNAAIIQEYLAIYDNIQQKLQVEHEMMKQLVNICITTNRNMYHMLHYHEILSCNEKILSILMVNNMAPETTDNTTTAATTTAAIVNTTTAVVNYSSTSLSTMIVPPPLSGVNNTSTSHALLPTTNSPLMVKNSPTHNELIQLIPGIQESPDGVVMNAFSPIFTPNNLEKKKLGLDTNLTVNLVAATTSLPMPISPYLMNPSSNNMNYKPFSMNSPPKSVLPYPPYTMSQKIKTINLSTETNHNIDMTQLLQTDQNNNNDNNNNNNMSLHELAVDTDMESCNQNMISTSEDSVDVYDNYDEGMTASVVSNEKGVQLPDFNAYSYRLPISKTTSETTVKSSKSHYHSDDVSSHASTHHYSIDDYSIPSSAAITVHIPNITQNTHTHTQHDKSEEQRNVTSDSDDDEDIIEMELMRILTDIVPEKDGDVKNTAVNNNEDDRENIPAAKMGVKRNYTFSKSTEKRVVTKPNHIPKITPSVVAATTQEMIREASTNLNTISVIKTTQNPHQSSMVTTQIAPIVTTTKGSRYDDTHDIHYSHIYDKTKSTVINPERDVILTPHKQQLPLHSEQPLSSIQNVNALTMAPPVIQVPPMKRSSIISLAPSTHSSITASSFAQMITTEFINTLHNATNTTSSAVGGGSGGGMRTSETAAEVQQSEGTLVLPSYNLRISNPTTTVNSNKSKSTKQTLLSMLQMSKPHPQPQSSPLITSQAVSTLQYQLSLQSAAQSGGHVPQSVPTSNTQYKTLKVSRYSNASSHKRYSSNVSTLLQLSATSSQQPSQIPSYHIQDDQRSKISNASGVLPQSSNRSGYGYSMRSVDEKSYDDDVSSLATGVDLIQLLPQLNTNNLTSAPIHMNALPTIQSQVNGVNTGTTDNREQLLQQKYQTAYITSLTKSACHQFRSIDFPGRPPVEDLILEASKLRSYNLSLQYFMNQIHMDILTTYEIYEMLSQYIVEMKLCSELKLNKIEFLIDFYMTNKNLNHKVTLTLETFHTFLQKIKLEIINSNDPDILCNNNTNNPNNKDCYDYHDHEPTIGEGDSFFDENISQDEQSIYMI